MSDDHTEDASAPDDERLSALLRRAAVPPAGTSPADALAAVFAVRRTVRRRRLRRSLTAGATTAALAGAAVAVTLTGGSAATPPVVLHDIRLTGALTSFNGCSDYLSYVRRTAAALVGPYGLQQLPPVFEGGGALSNITPDFAGAPARASTEAGPVAHSTTTDQVAGVDEPDTVKTDGRVVVTLTGSTLRVLGTGAQVLGAVQLDGDTGGGLILTGTRAVVFSSPVTPPSFGPGWVGPGYAPGPVPTTSQTGRATVVDLSDPTHPAVLHTFLFDGAVVAARLVGGDIRLVVRSDGPRIAFQTLGGPSTDVRTLTAENRRLVENSTLDQWLPSWQLVNPDGSATPRRHLAGCDAVARPQHASGISTVTVFSLDPTAAAPRPAVSVVAAGDTVYATADHVYLAGATATGPRPMPLPGGPAAPVGGGGALVEPCCGSPTRTWLYEFATPPAGPPRFVAAGSLPGSLLNSYAMDRDSRGYLRVATTVQNGSGSTDSRLTVLAVSGQSLVPVGTVAGLGRGQLIRAVRFIGDTAYVVTFRSYDPLYVIDLRDPHHPWVAGALEQPGYSEFLYPLPGQRLLGVGVVVSGGEPAGLLLAVYDVSDPAHPRRLSATPMMQGFFPASLGYDPHAFLYWPATSLAVLSLPTTDWYGSVSPAVAYRIGAGGSLTRLARLAHGRSAPSRVLVVGDGLWAVTDGGILVADLADPSVTSWHPY